MKLDQRMQARREQILAIVHKNGAHDVRIFGSVARGDSIPTVTLISW